MSESRQSILYFLSCIMILISCPAAASLPEPVDSDKNIAILMRDDFDALKSGLFFDVVGAETE